MNSRTTLQQHGQAAPFEALLREKARTVLAPVMSTEHPMTLVAIAEAAGTPVRPTVQVLSAMVRDGQADFVSQELGWILN